MTLFAGLIARHRRAWRVLVDTASGTWDDGFTHAGNLAYLSLLTLFPFFILVASVAGALGRTEDGLTMVTAFVRTLPGDVATLVAKPIIDVLTARASGGVLTFGVLVTLWTTSGFMETVRAIIRGAYQAPSSVSVWRYRLASVLAIFVLVLVMLVSLAAQVVLTGAQTFVERLMPFADTAFSTLGLSQLVPTAIIFLALWGIFYVLTPTRFRGKGLRTWPGALITALTWIGTTKLLPGVLSLLGGYSLTYGSLAGVIVALLFFYIIGLGLVIGANLNAALAKPRESGLKADAEEIADGA